MNTYELRRYSASGVYYGERIQSGSIRELLEWLAPVLERRALQGWNITRERMIFEAQHDDTADVIWYKIAKGKEE